MLFFRVEQKVQENYADEGAGSTVGGCEMQGRCPGSTVRQNPDVAIINVVFH